MIQFYQCEICRSKILENRLQKHHTKVHPDINYDIYTPLTDVASEIPSNNITNQGENAVPIVDSVGGLDTPKDLEMVHKQFNIYQNPKPAKNVDSHIKRKHGHTNDQVDAIGTNIDAMSLEKSVSTDMTGWLNLYGNKTIPSHLVSQPTSTKTVPAAVNPNPPIDRVKEDSKSDASKNIEPPFYTIRVNEAQMQQLLDQNRIYPKDGSLYLK